MHSVGLLTTGAIMMVIINPSVVLLVSSVLPMVVVIPVVVGNVGVL